MGVGIGAGVGVGAGLVQLKVKGHARAPFGDSFVKAIIKDLPQEEKAKEELIAEKPSWLVREMEETGRTPEDVLDQKIWFRLFTYLEYVPPNEVSETFIYKINF